MLLRSVLAAVAVLALAACGGEAPRTGNIDLRLLRMLESVRLDPARAASTLSDYRRSHGLGPVRIDPALMTMAQRQADAMAAANEMSRSVNGSFISRLAASGIGYGEAGENLGGGYYSFDEAMTGWRNSAEHNANLLLPNATRLGIAIAKNPQSSFGVYWAMVLASEPALASSAPGMLAAPASAAQ
jgi:hypothetical protein